MRPTHAAAVALLALAAAVPVAYAKTGCDLLTASEVNSLGGMPMGPARPMDTSCRWAALAGTGFIQAIMMQADSASEASQFVDMTLETEKSRQGQHPAPEMIPGLGDRAVLTYDLGGNATLTVAYRATALQLVIRANAVPMAPARKEAMIQAMKAMVSRL